MLFKELYSIKLKRERKHKYVFFEEFLIRKCTKRAKFKILNFFEIF